MKIVKSTQTFLLFPEFHYRQASYDWGGNRNTLGLLCLAWLIDDPAFIPPPFFFTFSLMNQNSRDSRESAGSGNLHLGRLSPW